MVYVEARLLFRPHPGGLACARPARRRGDDDQIETGTGCGIAPSVALFLSEFVDVVARTVRCRLPAARYERPKPPNGPGFLSVEGATATIGTLFGAVFVERPRTSRSGAIAIR